MCLFEYDQEKAMEAEREEGRAEGIKEGEAKGRANGIKEGEAKGRAEGIKEGETKGKEETILKLVNQNIISIEEGVKQLGISFEELEKKLKALFSNK